MAFQLGSVNKIFNTESESFQKSFNLTHKGDPIFFHEFDGGSSTNVLIGADTFVIKNHFFVAGEELEYSHAGNVRGIGIDHESIGIGNDTILPSSVFVIKVDENRFKLAATRAHAIANNPIGLTTVGVGTTHSFKCKKLDSRCIISIDSVLQSPIITKTGTATTTGKTVLNREVLFHDTTGFKHYDLVQIDDEVMRIQVIGFGTVANNVLVDRAWLGTYEQPHLGNAAITLLKGDYRIEKDQIHFQDVPFGGTRQTIGITSSAVNVADNTFTALTDVFDNGTKVKLRSLVPPAPLVANSDYFIIKNANNTFSLASDRGNAAVGLAITMTSAGIGTHKLLVADVVDGSTFQGRSFMRSDYSGNYVLDDLSGGFTGIAKTFTMTTNNGTNITGIGTDYGIILINNQFQKPDTDYEYDETVGITSIVFTGNDIAGQTETYSTSDVTANRLPRKGIIVSIGNSQGFGYQKLQAGIGTAVVSGFGTISAAIGFTGSGYRGAGTVFKVHVDGGSHTTSAGGTFSIQDGHLKTVWMDSPGVGYTWTNPPLLRLDAPYAYDDLALTSSGTGIGASVSVQVSAAGSISAPVLTKTGYGYTIGEKMTIAGIPTSFGAGTDFVPAEFTITDTMDDKFAGWVLGKFQILDDFSGEFNGSKTQFTIQENNKDLSIEKITGSVIELDQILLVFLNEVLQKPGVAYEFTGGTQIKFTEPPAQGTTCQILFYRGTDADIETASAVETITKGDTVTIFTSPKNRAILTQDPRTIREVVSRDTLQTTFYKGQGITAAKDPKRPVTWTKQKDDKFVDGVKVSKARGLYAGQVFPATNIIAGVGTTSTSIYAQSGIIAFTKTEDPNITEFGIRIVDSNKNNTGFGTTGFTNPYKQLEELSMDGDDGIIVGIGSTAQGIQFEFSIPSTSVLRDNAYGGYTETGIGTGDYFVVSRSNVGSGVTARSFNGSSTVGMTTVALDGVFQVSDIARVGSGQTIRVSTEIVSGHGCNFTGLSSGAGNYYGSYSWAKFTLAAGRVVGLAYTANTLNGLTGLTTAPEIQRTTKLSLDYT